MVLPRLTRARGRPPGPPAPPVDSAPPVPRPRAKPFKLVAEVLRHGGPGYLQFAITNICNAKCDFCKFAVDRFDPKRAGASHWTGAAT